MGIFDLITGTPGLSGFGSASTAEQVTDGIDASNLTVIITGLSLMASLANLFLFCCCSFKLWF